MVALGSASSILATILWPEKQRIARLVNQTPALLSYPSSKTFLWQGGGKICRDPGTQRNSASRPQYLLTCQCKRKQVRHRAAGTYLASGSGPHYYINEWQHEEQESYWDLLGLWTRAKLFHQLGKRKSLHTHEKIERVQAYRGNSHNQRFGPQSAMLCDLLCAKLYDFLLFMSMKLLWISLVCGCIVEYFVMWQRFWNLLFCENAFCISGFLKMIQVTSFCFRPNCNSTYWSRKPFWEMCIQPDWSAPAQDGRKPASQTPCPCAKQAHSGPRVSRQKKPSWNQYLQESWGCGALLRDLPPMGQRLTNPRHTCVCKHAPPSAQIRDTRKCALHKQ